MRNVHRTTLYELIDAECAALERQLREARALSGPIEGGGSRWADMDLSGYHRKTPEQLTAMYAHYQDRVTFLIARLAQLAETRRAVAAS